MCGWVIAQESSPNWETEGEVCRENRNHTITGLAANLLVTGLQLGQDMLPRRCNGEEEKGKGIWTWCDSWCQTACSESERLKNYWTTGRLTMSWQHWLNEMAFKIKENVQWGWRSDLLATHKNKRVWWREFTLSTESRKCAMRRWIEARSWNHVSPTGFPRVVFLIPCATKPRRLRFLFVIERQKAAKAAEHNKGMWQSTTSLWVSNPSHTPLPPGLPAGLQWVRNSPPSWMTQIVSALSLDVGCVRRLCVCLLGVEGAPSSHHRKQIQSDDKEGCGAKWLTERQLRFFSSSRARCHVYT